MLWKNEDNREVQLEGNQKKPPVLQRELNKLFVAISQA